MRLRHHTIKNKFTCEELDRYVKEYEIPIKEAIKILEDKKETIQYQDDYWQWIDIPYTMEYR